VNETIHLLQSNQIKCVGAGSSLSLAQEPLRLQCKGKNISFLAFAENEFNLADEKTQVHGHSILRLIFSR